MNAVTTQSATLPASHTGSRSPLPTPWIERLFARFEGMYGAKFHDAWRGTDLANVKAVWAEDLAGFADKPECIRAAIEMCKDSGSPWPPASPEFLAMCRTAANRLPVALPTAIEHKLSPKEIERNKARISELTAKFSRAKAADIGDDGKGTA